MKLMEQMKQFMQGRQYADSTIEVYCAHVKDYIRFHRKGTNWQHPKDLSARDFERWLKAGRSKSIAS